jgi:8-oxo-dGTP diphosphatase
MIYFAKDNTVTGIEECGKSVILRGESDRPWVFIASANETELEAIIGTLNQSDKNFAAVEDWMVPIITRNKRVEWDISLIKLVYPDHLSVPETDSAGIVPLSPADAEYIFENSLYRDYISPEYIRGRIRGGVSAGIYDAGKPSAWIATQDDCAMGFLHVMKAYRGKGYAKKLTFYMIRKLRERGIIPFIYIQETNSPSLTLAERLGFRREGKIHWFGIKTGE